MAAFLFCSLYGKIIQSSSETVLPQQILKMTVQAAAPGTYLVQVLRTDGKLAVKKWVKN